MANPTFDGVAFPAGKIVLTSGGQTYTAPYTGQIPIMLSDLSAVTTEIGQLATLITNLQSTVLQAINTAAISVETAVSNNTLTLAPDAPAA